VKHLVFQCLAHDHARRDTWPGDSLTTDPRCLWSYLEWIGAVTCPLPPPGNERERESRNRRKSLHKNKAIDEFYELNFQTMEKNQNPFSVNRQCYSRDHS